MLKNNYPTKKRVINTVGEAQISAEKAMRLLAAVRYEE